MPTGAFVAQQDTASVVDVADYFNTHDVFEGVWQLSGWNVFVGPAGTAKGTGLSAKRLLELGDSAAQLATTDGGTVRTETATWTACDGVLISDASCGASGNQYLEVISADDSTTTLYDGTSEWVYAALDAGANTLSAGASCATDQVVCGGLSNFTEDGVPDEATLTSAMPPAVTATNYVPDSDIYFASAVEVYQQPAGSNDDGHAVRFALELTDQGSSGLGVYRIAYARDAAFSTRFAGTYVADLVTNKMTFSPSCPSSEAAFSVPFDEANFCLSLYFTAGQLGFTADTEVDFDCD